MTFKRKNEAAIISGSSLLRSILLSGGLLICAIIALTLWTLREDWHGAVRQHEWFQRATPTSILPPRLRPKQWRRVQLSPTSLVAPVHSPTSDTQPSPPDR